MAQQLITDRLVLRPWQADDATAALGAYGEAARVRSVEAVVERVLREYGPALRQGAVFYNADATEPTILWLIKSGVEDGRGQTTGERLFAVHLSGGRYRRSQPYALLDLKAPESPPALAPELKAAAVDEDAAV